MTIFSKEILALRFMSRTEFGGYVALVKRYKVFGFVIWSRELEREDYPAWADIQRGTLGFTEWRSKLAEKAAVG